jgi:hypothetical protein
LRDSKKNKKGEKTTGVKNNDDGNNNNNKEKEEEKEEKFQILSPSNVFDSYLKLSSPLGQQKEILDKNKEDNGSSLPNKNVKEKMIINSEINNNIKIDVNGLSEELLEKFSFLATPQIIINENKEKEEKKDEEEEEIEKKMDKETENKEENEKDVINNNQKKKKKKKKRNEWKRERKCYGKFYLHITFCFSAWGK